MLQALIKDFLREGGASNLQRGLFCYYLPDFSEITNGNEINMTQREVEPKEVLKTEGGFKRYLTEVSV